MQFLKSANINKSTVGIYVQKDKSLIEVLMLKDSEKVVQLPLKSSSNGHLKFKVKGMGESDELYGSISVPIDSYFTSTAALNQDFTQWMTLFDNENDDEFDGLLNESD